MFWSAVPPFAPGDTVETLNTEWFPGSEYVDIVGLDAYGEILSGEQTTFETLMGAFCALYPDIPVALAETGWLNGGTVEEKEYWLGQVSAKETLDVCPQYIGKSPTSQAFLLVFGIHRAIFVGGWVLSHNCSASCKERILIMMCLNRILVVRI